MLLLAVLTLAIEEAHVTRWVVNLASWWQLVYATRHKSCHLLLLLRMSFDEQSAIDHNVYSLCEKEEKTKINFDEEMNSPRVLLPANLSFAIDAQHDKRRSLHDWHPDDNWTIQQGTSLATCFG